MAIGTRRYLLRDVLGNAFSLALLAATRRVTGSFGSGGRLRRRCRGRGRLSPLGLPQRLADGSLLCGLRRIYKYLDLTRRPGLRSWLILLGLPARTTQEFFHLSAERIRLLPCRGGRDLVRILRLRNGG